MSDSAHDEAVNVHFEKGVQLQADNDKLNAENLALRNEIERLKRGGFTFCEVCNFPLSQIGEQSVDGEPTLDCKICILTNRLAESERQAAGMLDALAGAWAAIWDAHYGKGLDIAYARKVDAEIRAAKQSNVGKDYIPREKVRELIKAIEDAAYSAQDWSGTYLGETIESALASVEKEGCVK